MARPRLVLTDAQVAQVEVLAGYGLSERAIAHVLGFSHDTLARRKRESERVAQAVARGKAKAEGLVGEALFKRARAGDVPAIKWWEMTRAGRSERTHATAGTADLATLTDAQLERVANGEDLARVLRNGPLGDA